MLRRAHSTSAVRLHEQESFQRPPRHLREPTATTPSSSSRASDSASKNNVNAASRHHDHEHQVATHSRIALIATSALAPPLSSSSSSSRLINRGGSDGINGADLSSVRFLDSSNDDDDGFNNNSRSKTVADSSTAADLIRVGGMLQFAAVNNSNNHINYTTRSPTFGEPGSMKMEQSSSYLFSPTFGDDDGRDDVFDDDEECEEGDDGATSTMSDGDEGERNGSDIVPDLLHSSTSLLPKSPAHGSSSCSSPASKKTITNSRDSQSNQQQQQQLQRQPSQESIHRRRSLLYFLKKIAKSISNFRHQHRRLIFPSSASPNAPAHCKTITVWAVLRQLPFWYQAFSALIVVIFILFFASQNSLVGAMLSALHVTFGMEALWPAVYQKHLATISLNERLAFAGYAVLLGVCGFVYHRFITSPKLTHDLPLLKQLVYADEKPFVNSRLIHAVVFLPAVVEAAMAVRGNMEDVFADMGDAFHSENSHWRLQASAMAWTMDYWKQVVIIPACCTLAWRLAVDLSGFRPLVRQQQKHQHDQHNRQDQQDQREYCSQRWNLVSFCAWRNVVAFAVFPQRFFCWVGAAGFIWYLMVLGAVNYCSSSTSATLPKKAAAASSPTSSAAASNGVDENVTSPSIAATSARRSGRVTTVRFEGDSVVDGGLSPSRQQHDAAQATPATATPYELRRQTEFGQAESTREVVLVTVAATARSASVIPFLCVAVLTILAGVHVVELLGLWLCVFVFLTWCPAVLRSFATDAMALLCFAVATVLLFWLDQLRLIDLRNSSEAGGGRALEGYERLHATLAVSFTLFMAAAAASAWCVIFLSLPFKKFRVVSRWRYRNVPVLVWSAWFMLAYVFVFGFRHPASYIWFGSRTPSSSAANPSLLPTPRSYALTFFSWVPGSSWFMSDKPPYSPKVETENNTSVSDPESSDALNCESKMSSQHQPMLNIAEQVIVTDEATRKVSRASDSASRFWSFIGARPFRLIFRGEMTRG